jgi:hypothetical protein
MAVSRTRLSLVVMLVLAMCVAESACLGAARSDEGGGVPTVTGPVPSEQSTCVCGTAVQFIATATGSPALAYHWRRGETNLSDGLKYAGATTPTLTIMNLDTWDAGNNYNCIVSDSDGTAVSDMATLIVADAMDGDFDHDCDIDAEDAVVFQGCLTGAGGPPSADCGAEDLDGDGDVDMSDFGILQRSYGSQGQQQTATSRDIVFVLDLSGSMSRDSLLESCKRIEIANRGVWAYLWDPAWGDPPTEGGMPAGPSVGHMSLWGDAVTGPNGINVDDPGLVYLPKGQSWTLTAAWASQMLAAHGYGMYTTAEMAVINSSAYDSDLSAYRRRVEVALGLVRWRSGKAGGQAGGNGNSIIDAIEVSEVLVPYPSEANNPVTHCRQVGGSWNDYVTYVASTAVPMWRYDPDNGQFGDPNCRYRYGLKTWVDFVQTACQSNVACPGLTGAPQQPLQTAIDAIGRGMGLFQAQQADDLVGLAGFATYGYGPADKPDHMSWLTGDFGLIAARTHALPASMLGGFTNTAQGIDKAVSVLFESPQSRSEAAKIIVLFTDGFPNMTRSPVVYDELQASLDAEAAASDAAARGVIIHTVGLGQNCMWQSFADLLTELAVIGRGNSFTVTGDVCAWHAQIQDMLWYSSICD